MGGGRIESRRAELGARVALAAFDALLAGGMLAAAAFQSRAGVFVAVAGLGGRSAPHLLRSVVAYRRVMARPWPAVAPLTDDD